MEFFIVDCFAEEKYQGNQLLVVLADRPLSDREQQGIAREINFSETAFILSGKQRNGGYDVRIWTPSTGEVPFAGHPTLGTAYVISKIIEKKESDEVRLNLAAGQIPVKKSAQGMTMKQNPPTFESILDREELADVFGIKASEICEDYPIELVSTGLESVSVPLKTRETLARLVVNQSKYNEYIARHPECNCNHLFFVNMGDNLFAARCLMEDFVEDPATGSANGNLAAYLLKHNYFNSSEISYLVHQGEDMGRKSVLHLYGKLDNDNWTIEVGGKCHIVARGQWHY